MRRAVPQNREPEANRSRSTRGASNQSRSATDGRRDCNSARVPSGTQQARLDQAELLKRFDLNQDQRLDATEQQQALEAMRNKTAD